MLLRADGCGIMQTEIAKQFAMEKLQIWLPFDTTFCLKLLSKMANAFKNNFFFKVYWEEHSHSKITYLENIICQKLDF